MARFSLLIGVLSLVLAASVSIGSGQERVPVPGGVYAGTLTDVTGVCSDGGLIPSVTVTISDYGYRIERFTLTQAYPQPTPASSFSLPTFPIPVAADGSFSQHEALQLDGRFAGTGVSGSFRFYEGDLLGCAGTFTAQLRPSDRVEETFAGQAPLVDGCGGGTYSITRSADLLSIVRISVDGLHAGDTLFSGSGTFPEGTVPIDPQTGWFDWVYFPGREPGQEIAVNGTFAAGTQANGLIAVSPSTCNPVAFSGNALVPVPAGGKGGGLPSSGAGRSGGGSPVLPVSALLASGLALVLGGRALRRHLR